MFAKRLALLLALLPAFAFAQLQSINLGTGPNTPGAVTVNDAFNIVNANDQLISNMFGASGLLVGNGPIPAALTAATYLNVVSLFTCTDTSMVLTYGGACISAAGSVSGGSNLVYATPNGTSGNASLRRLLDTDVSLSTLPPVTVVADSVTGNLTLSGVQTIDGQAGTAGTTLVLASAQTVTSQNGPWIMQSGAWTRPQWYPSGGTTQAVQFETTLIRLGTTYAGAQWRMTTAGNITIDTTGTTWVVTKFALNASTVASPISGAVGGTGNGFFSVSGPASSLKTYTFPNVNMTVAGLAVAQTWAALQTFTNSDLALLGSSTGFTTFTSDNAGASNFTIHVPAANDTLVTLAATQTLTNKSIAGSEVNSGTVPCAQQPALTGAVTSSAGACATVFGAQSQNVQSGSYTAVLADANNTIYHNSGSAHTFTIPANASVAYPVNTTLEFDNETGGGVVTIAITTDTLTQVGTGLTGSRTLNANGVCVARKVATTQWFLGGTCL